MGRSFNEDPSGSQVGDPQTLVADALDWKLNNAIDSKRRILPNRADWGFENPDPD
jgi:hypothetical protein